MADAARAPHHEEEMGPVHPPPHPYTPMSHLASEQTTALSASDSPPAYDGTSPAPERARRRRWLERHMFARVPPVLHNPCVLAGILVFALFCGVFALVHFRDLAVHPYQGLISFCLWLLIGLVVVATAQTIYISTRFVCN